MTSRTIYGLYYLDPSAPERRRYFYVGRSIDARRREQQHRTATAKGHEDKYEFMRKLELDGIAWHREALRVIPDGEYPPDSERWFVIKLTRDGHRLTNMRHGSEEHRKELAEQVLSPRIRRLEDVATERKRRSFEASKRLQRKVLVETLRKHGIPNVEAATVLPPVLRRRVLREDGIPIERGLTLAEVVRLTRAGPMLRRMFEQANKVRPLPPVNRA